MRALIAAEIASNWEGSISKAKKLIKECKNAGADAVKFQMWRALDLYKDNHPEWNIIKKSELTFEKARELKIYSDEVGIEFFCSGFYPEAIEFLDSIKVKRYKIASRTCTLKDPHSLETITKISDYKKPVVISMGMGGDRKRIEKIFSNNKKIFCYCISEYPTKIDKIDWKNAIKYDGFSDHTLGITASLIFAMLKKKQNSKNILIEKHVKLRNSRGPDADSSINTEELADLVSAVKKIEKLKF